MSHVLIELGFDCNAGSINRMLGDDPNNPAFSHEVFPLQHAFVSEPDHVRARPMWGTQLQPGDQLAFRIFDLTRAALPVSRTIQPIDFQAHFRHPNRPDEDHDIFDGHCGPVASKQFKSLGLARSHAYGHFDRDTESKGCFPAWDLAGAAAKAYRVAPCPKSVRLQRAFMAISLEIQIGSKRRVYFFDPEVYVSEDGGGGTSGEQPSDDSP
ncbi:MAG: hypothetical protein AAF772_07165 [Acidobacteriota bacterium]